MMENEDAAPIGWGFGPHFFLISLLSACGCGDDDSPVGVVDSGADSTPPFVVSTSPSDFATNVARNSVIMATFSEGMLASTIDTGSFTLAVADADPILGNISLDSANNLASFVPNTPLSALADYTATLSTGITDLGGNALVANYSWLFTTADGAWGDAELIEFDNSGAGDDSLGSQYDPQIAFDLNGTAPAVWSQSDGNSIGIWGNRFDGSSWGTAEVIVSGSTGAAFGPQVAFDDNGIAFAVWYQSEGALTSILAKRFDGSSWGTAELIQTDGSGSAIRPEIGLDSNGTALALWRQFDGNRYNVWSNRFE